MKKKIFCILLLGISFALFSPAQNIISRVSLSLDGSRDGIYRKGQTVKVFARTQSETPALMQVYINGKSNGDPKKITLPAGQSEIFSGSWDEATAVMVRLDNPNARKDSTLIGAVVAPEEFKPGFEEPSDFAGFWDGQLASMRAMPMVPVLIPIQVSGWEGDLVKCYDVEINCTGDVPVRGYLAIPRDAAPGSLPIIITAHSAGKMTDSWTQSKVETAVRYARMGGGAIALDINAHGMKGNMDESYYKDLEDKLHGYESRKITDHESFYFRTMFLRMVRALDFLCTLPQWDGTRVAVTGTSQGGAQSAALAGLDSRVGLIAVDVPAMWDMGGILRGRSSSWGKHLEREGINSPAAQVVPYYDGANFLRHYHGKLVVNVGLIDTTCPPASVWSAYNVCPSTDKVIYAQPSKGHSRFSLTREASAPLHKKIDQSISNALKNYCK